MKMARTSAIACAEFVALSAPSNVATHCEKADYQHVLRAKFPTYAAIFALHLLTGCNESDPVGTVAATTSESAPNVRSSTSALAPGVMSRADAIAAAQTCAKTKHGGLGIWKSALRLDSPSATTTSGNWYVVFTETEPKGKPQGLTLIIAADGICTEAAME